MQVGACPGRLNTWRPVLQKFKNKLASWESASLSMAGRVVLIKSALCNLPLYYASMFKMSIAVALEMEKIQRRFLWGSADTRRKRHFVKWSMITKPKQYGGLGIQGMVDKNLVLLAKWWWKLVTGKGGLWRRMLSTCWKDIIKSVQGNSEVALAFKEGLKLKLGNGKTISFWYDVWMGDKPIKDQYTKLFIKSVQGNFEVALAFKEGLKLKLGNGKTISFCGGFSSYNVGNGFLGWGSLVMQLTFSRILYQWEEVYKRELEEGLRHVQLKDEENDRIVWSFSADGSFSTNSLMRAAMAIRSRKKKWE
ncbi:hypothetical protein QQ045_014266 [Rhodiola kirilowii]